MFMLRLLLEGGIGLKRSHSQNQEKKKSELKILDILFGGTLGWPGAWETELGGDVELDRKWGAREMRRGSCGVGAAPGDRPGGVPGKLEKRVGLGGIPGRHRVVEGRCLACQTIPLIAPCLLWFST